MRINHNTKRFCNLLCFSREVTKVLLPYNYSNSCEYFPPTFRHLWLNEPREPSAIGGVSSSFLYFLVAPVKAHNEKRWEMSLQPISRHVMTFCLQSHGERLFDAPSINCQRMRNGLLDPNCAWLSRRMGRRAIIPRLRRWKTSCFDPSRKLKANLTRFFWLIEFSPVNQTRVNLQKILQQCVKFHLRTNPVISLSNETGRIHRNKRKNE